MRACRAKGGYCGGGHEMQFAACTSPPTRIGAVGTGGGGGGGAAALMMPPNTPPALPPATPPTTPPVEGGGGGAVSFTIAIFLGITFGASNWLFWNSLTMRCTTTLGVGGAGGGGGGGGGGAVKNALIAEAGRTSQ